MSPYMLVHGDTGEVDERGNPVRVHAIWDASAIEATGTYTLRLNTRVPQIALPQHLQHGALSILDPAEDGVFGPGSNGTGAFELVEVEPGKHALLRAVDDHWSDGPYLDEARFIDPGENGAHAVAALAARRLHLLRSRALGDPEPTGPQPHLQPGAATSSETAAPHLHGDYTP